MRTVGRIAGLLISAGVVNEPGRDADDEDDRTDDEQRKTDEDSEGDEHHGEAEDWGREARRGNMDRVLFAMV